jgi:hypothetical protein
VKNSIHTIFRGRRICRKESKQIEYICHQGDKG